ncbi:shufflon system plasmid conjugative transfer pilus tip adhesin PilV [Dickeya chrysanthemi]|uniref:shufflon system plasmid conjugative transfer pilus tip adhesin PilV n=1 Tax=Dickeya chrysanthemi TaxID=556 RepID=UPI000532DCA0|nr:shufflon system plasmid conjugative transfer pilus tip adhesin PilV [Dickeya chrysanthemi]
MKKQNKKGFSLLELILVLGVGTTVTFMKFQDMKNEQETVVAKAVGEQIKQMGEAVNGYINIRYDKLSTLTSSSSQSSDPGPRTCSGSVCEITYQTLVNEGLLPSSFSGVNAQKSSYKIFLRRSGNVPNYIINGLITTTNVWADGGKVRYDLLGKAMQTAGIDSGMTKTTTAASGYGGQWSELSTDYGNITAAGLLAYRVGYDSAMYSVYLRRDGTLPMTGDLNMGGQSIYNAQNITAAGTTTTGVLKTVGAATVGADLTVAGNTQVNGNVNANNTVSGATVVSRGETYTQNWFRTLGDGGIYFQKYGGGWNMADTETINAYGGKNVQTSGGLYGGYVHSNGNVDAVGAITAGSYLRAHNGYGNVLYIGGDAAGDDFEITLTGQKQIDLLSDDYSPITLAANGRIEVRNPQNGSVGVNINHDGSINSIGTIAASGNINANGRINAGEFIYVNGQANIGTGCLPNGLIGRDGAGKAMSCVNGVWSSFGGSTIVRSADFGSSNLNRNSSGVVNCASNEHLISGGVSCLSSAGLGFIIKSQPASNGWYGLCGDSSQNMTGITVWAVCSQ